MKPVGLKDTTIDCGFTHNLEMELPTIIPQTPKRIKKVSLSCHCNLYSTHSLLEPSSMY